MSTYKPGDIANNHVLEADGVTWRLLPPPDSTPPDPKPEVKPMSWGKKFVIGFFLTLGLGGCLAVVGGDDDPAGVSGVTYSLLNPSSIRVTWTVDSDAGHTVNCRVHARDASRHYSGSDTALDIEPGETVWIPLTISNNGAAYITEVTVEC